MTNARTTPPHQIASLDELKKLARAIKIEAFIMLNGGMRSSKVIEYNPAAGAEPWCITNEIDDSHQDLTDSGLWSDSNIGPALDAGALYLYPWSETA